MTVNNTFPNANMLNDHITQVNTQQTNPQTITLNQNPQLQPIPFKTQTPLNANNGIYPAPIYNNQPNVIIINHNDNLQNSDETANSFPKDKDEPKNAIESLNEGTLESRARLNFVKKVYTIVMAQLLLTIGICFISFKVQPFYEFQLNNIWMFIVCLLLSIALIITIYCCAFARRHPVNLILLISFTLLFSYMFSYATSSYIKQYGGPLVIQALVITIAVVSALTFYAMVTRTDFTVKYGIIIVVLIGFIVFGMLVPWSETPILHKLYCTLGVIISGILIVVDTQLIMGGDRDIKIPLDDYVMGALMLYVDIIRIFTFILRLVK